MEPEFARSEIIDERSIRHIKYHPIRVSPKTLWSFVEVQTDDGLSGIGEATFFRGAHDFPNTVSRFNERLNGLPLEAVSNQEYLPDENDTTEWAVLSAIEHAGWDIKGKRSAQPVFDLLGPKINEQIPLYANINRRTRDRTPKGFVESVRKAEQEGFTKLKIAPFDNMSPETSDNGLFQAGLDRIRATHNAMDDKNTLMVDCHWRLDLKRAFEVLEIAADLKLGWVECPLPETSENMAELKAFKEHAHAAGIAIAGGEQGTSYDYFDRILGEGIYDIIMPDVKYVGGISRLLDIAKLAKNHGVTFSPHNPSGPVAHLASLHAATVIENLAMLEHQFDEAPLFWTLSDTQLPSIEQGFSQSPNQHGLGFSALSFPDKVA